VSSFLCERRSLLIMCLYRIPEFLLSIDDPRASNGGALKGCPICGGESSRVNYPNRGYLTICIRSGSRTGRLSKTRRSESQNTSCPNKVFWRWLLDQGITIQ
jgi:hypothetical protein